MTCRQNSAVFRSLMLIVLIVLAGCHRTPDDIQIRQNIDAASRAAQEADAGAFGTLLTDDFTGNEGDADKNALLNMLRVIHLRGESVHVVMGPVEIEPRGGRYIAHFSVTLASGSSLLAQNAGIYSVETAWRRDGREWRCFSASWKPSL